MAEEGFINTVYGTFLGNVYDPLNLDISWPIEHRDEGESQFEARARYVRWLTTKTVGPPMATPEYEEADLRAMGFVGVYYNPGAGDTVCSAEEVSRSFPAGLTDVEFLGKKIYTVFKERHD